MPVLTDDVRALFDGPNYGHIATTLPDGSPHSVAVWVGRREDRIVFFTQPTNRKARNLAADPRCAISITDHEDPYRTAQVRGRLVETIEGEEALEIIDAISQRYTGRPFPMRDGTVFVIEPERASFVALPFSHAPA